MQIRRQDIGYKKKIGLLKGRPVFEIGCKGGYVVVCSPNGNKIDQLGAGPHRAVARFIAKQTAPDVEIDELSKADWVDPDTFAHLLPYWVNVTNALNELSSAR
jgi:hypothetical protein